MYVIVEMQGQQMKVQQGQKLFINKVESERGTNVEFDKVLLIDNAGVITIGEPTIAGAKVVVEVVSQVKGDKVLVFHKKRRKGYRKLNGHRQQFTEVLVKEIIA